MKFFYRFELDQMYFGSEAEKELPLKVAVKTFELSGDTVSSIEVKLSARFYYMNVKCC